MRLRQAAVIGSAAYDDLVLNPSRWSRSFS